MNIKRYKAQSLLEILVALGVGVIMIGGATTLMALSLRMFKSSRERYDINTLLRQQSESTIALANSNWHTIGDLSTTTEYTLISNQNTWNATSCQSLFDFDFSAIDSGYSPGWDTNLNLTYKPSLGFNSGYNSGGASSSIGYHAHINPTAGLDGTPAFEFIDENCQFGLCHRWLGFTYNLGTPASRGWGAGKQITVSLYGKTNTIAKPINFGLYYYNTAGTQTFHSGQPTLYFNTPNVWQRQNYTFTLINDIDTSKNLILFVYGHFGAEGRLWVDNVRLFDNTNCIKIANSRNYLQSFTLSDVFRDNGNIVSFGGVKDPNTKKIAINTEDWGTATNRNVISFYLTRSSNNQVIQQTDWAGGPGQTGPIPNPGNKFDTSDSNINYASTTGSIYMTTASSTVASLTSSIIDTGVSGGAGFNSLLWQGSLGTGGVVKFQIAFSNNQAGPWTYYGPTATSDYYQPNPGVSIAFPTTGSASPQNMRYIRYKVYLSTSGTTPQVNDIIINWSP